MSFLVNAAIKNFMYSYNSRFIVPFRFLHITRVNLLYSQAAIGIDGYLQTRKRTKEQFLNFSDKFKSKMVEFVSDPKSVIFTEDLKNMVHMAEPTDLELVTNMIKKFNSSNSEFRFGSFVFGPVVMRMFYFLDAPNEALKCFEDPTNKGFFDQLVSYQVLLDLLYNHEMYDEIYRVFDYVMKRQINMTKFPKYPLLSVLAACYKQNTPEALEYASKLWTELSSLGTVPLRRTSCFMAALALKQGKPEIALETISSQRQGYVTIRNIKAMALADIGRVEDSLPVLRNVLDIDIPDDENRHTFFEETMIRLRQAIEKKQDKDVKKQFEDIEKALRDRNLIDKQTLDDLLNAEVSIVNKKDRPRGMPSKNIPFSHRHRNL